MENNVFWSSLRTLNLVVSKKKKNPTSKLDMIGEFLHNNRFSNN